MCNTSVANCYQSARSQWLKREHTVQLYQGGTKKPNMHMMHHSFGIGSGLRLETDGWSYTIERRKTETILTKLVENMSNIKDF